MQYPTAIENYTRRLLGLEAPHLVFDERFQTQLAVDIQKPLHALADLASAAGFDLQVASHYRSFDRQLLIWNEKVRGIRPVLDAQGQPLDLRSMSDSEKVFAILRWSALPGTSRHHWGTEVDVFDAAHLPSGYRVQLTLEETLSGGVFSEFHRWLTDYFSTTPAAEFFRPYQKGVGAVAEEPWHLSYAPLANIFSAMISESILAEQIKLTDLELQATVLENLPRIFENYVRPYQPFNKNSK